MRSGRGGPGRWRWGDAALGWLFAWLLATAFAPAHAHKASDAYLQIQVHADAVTVRWDIALRDLDSVLPLDADGDRVLRWGEVRSAWAQIDTFAGEHLSISGCELMPVAHALEQRSDGVYAALSLRADCTPPLGLPIRYTLLADVDATHRGIARITHADGRVEVRLLDPAAASAAGSATTGGAGGAWAFVLEGVHHIITGYDHVLFLLCLLLPSVLRRTPAGWEPVARPRDALLPAARVATLFTVAHSITLALAALGKLSLPSWFVEPMIAATIIAAAVDNLRPLFGRFRALVTFVFGLIHGFGFAGVLAEIELPAGEFGWALFRFNLGLELGQLVIVALVVPLLYVLRDRPGYRRWVLIGGSLAAIAVAGYWLLERTLGLPR